MGVDRSQPNSVHMMIRKQLTLAVFLPLLFALGASTAHAQQGARTAPTPQVGGACGGVKSAGGGSEDINHFTCTCSGAGTVLQGGIETPVGGFSGGYTSAPPLTCVTYEVIAPYDAFDSNGHSLVQSTGFVQNLLYTAKCNTSGGYWVSCGVAT